MSPPFLFSRRKLRKLSRLLVLLHIGLLFLHDGVAVANPPAPNVLPQNGSVVAGSAAISQSGNTLSIHQSTDRAVINWQSFSIGANATTQFNVPNSSSATLNRVTGGNPTAIYGSLQSNGQVYLVNPSGIVIGPGATIDTAALAASTLNVNTNQFMRGGDLDFSGDSLEGVYNYGNIRAVEGDIFLIGATVENHGSLTALNGTVGLAAGQSVTLVDSSRPYLKVNASSRSLSESIIKNTGSIQGLRAELLANGGNVYGLAINNEGVVRATGAVEKDGRVYLVANGGKVVNKGDLIAKGGKVLVDPGIGGTAKISGTIDVAGIQGGQVHILGDNVFIESALIDASGTNGGGQVRIGGDFQGQGDLRTASNTVVDANSVIRVDALEQGNGGNVIVWANQATEYYGTISGRGGAAGGNGGFAEVSGKQDLVFQGGVDLSAVSGNNGTLLLDPTDFDINAANFTAIQNALALGNLLITTSGGGGDPGDITIDHAVTWNSGNLLELRAHRNIVANDNLDATASGGITLVAGWDGVTTDIFSMLVTDFDNVLSNDFTPFPDNAAKTRFGQNNGSGIGNVILDAQAAGQPVRIHSKDGNIRVFAGNLLMDGGTLGPATLGSATANTLVRTTEDVRLGSGGSYAQIGIDGATASHFGLSGGSGSIDVRACRDVILETQQQLAYAQIGNGEPATLSMDSGDINVRAERNVRLLTPFRETFAKIGNGSPFSFGEATGDVYVTANAVGMNAIGVDLLASAEDSYAQIGNGGFGFLGKAAGKINVTSGLDILAAGGRKRGAAQIGNWAPYAFGNITVQAYRDLALSASQNGTAAIVGHWFDSSDITVPPIIIRRLPAPNLGNGVVLAGHIDAEAGRNILLTAGDHVGNIATGEDITGGDRATAQIGHHAKSTGRVVAGGGILVAGNVDAVAGTMTNSEGDIVLQAANRISKKNTAEIGHIASYTNDDGPIEIDNLPGLFELPPAVVILGRVHTQSRRHTILAADGKRSTARIGHWGKWDGVVFDSGDYDFSLPGGFDLADYGLDYGLDGLAYGNHNLNSEFEDLGLDLLEFIGPGVYVLGGVKADAGIENVSGGDVDLAANGRSSTAQIGNLGQFRGSRFQFDDDYNPRLTGVFMLGRTKVTAREYDGTGGDVNLYAGGSNGKQLRNTSQIGHRGDYDSTELILVGDGLFEDGFDYGHYGFGAFPYTANDLASVVIVGGVKVDAQGDVYVGAGGSTGRGAVVAENRAQIGHQGNAKSRGFIIEDVGGPIIVDLADGGEGGRGNHSGIPVDVAGAGAFALGNINVTGRNVYVRAVANGPTGKRNMAQIGHTVRASGGRYDGFSLGQDILYGEDLEDVLPQFVNQLFQTGGLALGNVTVDALDSVHVKANGFTTGERTRGKNSAQIGHEVHVLAKRSTIGDHQRIAYQAYLSEEHGDIDWGQIGIGPLALAVGNIRVRARRGDVYVHSGGFENDAQIGHEVLLRLKQKNPGRGLRFYDQFEGDWEVDGHHGHQFDIGLGIALGQTTVRAGHDVSVVNFGRGSNDAQIGHEVVVERIERRTIHRDVVIDIQSDVENEQERFAYKDSAPAINVMVGLALGGIDVAARGNVNVHSLSRGSDAQIGHEVGVMADIHGGAVPPNPWRGEIPDVLANNGPGGFSVTGHFSPRQLKQLLSANNMLGIAYGDIHVRAGKTVSVVTGSNPLAGRFAYANDNRYEVFLDASHSDAQIGHEVNVSLVENQVLQLPPNGVQTDEAVRKQGSTSLATLIGLGIGDIEVKAGDDVNVHALANFSDSQIGHETNVEALRQLHDYAPMQDSAMYGDRDRVLGQGKVVLLGVSDGNIFVRAGNNVSLLTGIDVGALHGHYDGNNVEHEYEFDPGFAIDAQVGHETNVRDGRGMEFPPHGLPITVRQELEHENPSKPKKHGHGSPSLALANGNIFVIGGQNVLMDTFASTSDTQIGHEVNAGNRGLMQGATLFEASEYSYSQGPHIKPIAKGDIKVVAIVKDVEMEVHDHAFFSQSQIGHEVTGKSQLADTQTIGRSEGGEFERPRFVKGSGTALGDVFVLAGRDIRMINDGAGTSEVHIGHGSGRGFIYKRIGGDIVGIAGRDFVMEGASEFDVTQVGHGGAWSDINDWRGRILIAFDQANSKADENGRFFMDQYSRVDSGQRLKSTMYGTKLIRRKNLAIFVGTRREGAPNQNVIQDGAFINGVVYDSSLEGAATRTFTQWGENTEFENWEAEQWGFELWDIIDNPSLHDLLETCNLDLNIPLIKETYTGPFTFYYLDREQLRAPDIQRFDFIFAPIFPTGIGSGSMTYGEGEEREENELAGSSSNELFNP